MKLNSELILNILAINLNEFPSRTKELDLLFLLEFVKMFNLSLERIYSRILK